MGSAAALDVVIWMFAAIAAGGAVLGALSYYWHRNTRDVVVREHHVTRGEIDRVLECVEPDPVPEKPPIGFRTGV